MKNQTGLGFKDAEPTTPENKKKIDDMLSRNAGHVAALYGRWQDEREHEDIADYAAAIAPRLGDGFALVKMSKRPFGFDFSLDGKAYRISVNSTSCAWKRLYR